MKHILRQFFQREAHPVVQFLKYSIAGGLATLVDIVIFSLLGWKVFPCLKEGELVVRWFDLAVPQLSDVARAIHYVLSKSLTFLVSNFVAYITNVIWVFHPGRHSRGREIFLFYAVSVTSFILGTLLAAALIRWLGIGTAPAYIANMLASLSINYAGRKFFVFQR